MPLCLHPATTLLVDDNVKFLNNMEEYLSDYISVKTFSDPNEAINYMNNNRFTIYKDRCYYEKNGKLFFDLVALRDEIYNDGRFKEILTSVIDYDMPNKNGFDLILSIGDPLVGLQHHSYILLTGTDAETINKEFKPKEDQTIYKFDPEYQDKTLEAIKENSIHTSQWCSSDIAMSLARDESELTSILFDGNFLPIINDYIKKNEIIELYLFDKQGSFLFLDKYGNLSWLFVRNEKGIENSIRKARELNAPDKIVDALKSKQFICSLYEKEDFDRRVSIDWDQYLLPALKFSGDRQFLDAWADMSHSNYYYSFTKNFPDSGIDQSKILSYDDFMKQQK